MNTNSLDLNIRYLGLQDYQHIWQKMSDFTTHRTVKTADEIWILEHYAVFTQGRSGKAEHLLRSTDIPVVKSDRGGQITYHGPGQIIVYLLINLRRQHVNVRALVSIIEQSVINLLADHDVIAVAKVQAPGVYVNGKKIASLGLKIRKGCSFHGVALNVDMDLVPFSCINPCGYAGLEMTQCKQEGINCATQELSTALVKNITQQLMYSKIECFFHDQ
ncbi:MAG: lipoyl(octanoyl) transferase LipB [Psychromonas sp.]|nr:lipoyl(octanoyl) transferase LipB [Psychromonas sp.]